MAITSWSSESFSAVGRCIYARAGENHPAPFTDEHIIPFGLLPKGGDWFLPAASCRPCMEITTKFEETCLRGTLSTIRAKLDLKTRRKKKREVPQQLVRKKPDGSSKIELVHHSDLPHYCIGFVWPEAGILRGQSPGSYQFDGRIVVHYRKDELENFIPDKHGVRLARIRELDFARMLAKIAHSYAFAKCGIDTFEPYLLDLILGTAEDAPYLVGGDPTLPLPTQPDILHDLFPVGCKLQSSGAEYLAIAIRLFAFMDMPRYLVVVGRQLRELPFPKLSPSDG